MPTSPAPSPAFAASYRIGGLRDYATATDALRLAWPPGQLADDPLAEGISYQKVAYL